jgi:hypothetical protein
MNEQRKNLLSEIMQEDDKDGLYNTQTAVEWLVQQLQSRFGTDIERLSITDQAKEMEKEQIKAEVDKVHDYYKKGI